MKKLVSSTGFEAMPITEINELTSIDEDEVAGIVISTALSSTVKEKYWEVVQRSAAIFPGKSIFLASYATVRSAKITAGAHIKNAGLDYELLSIEEAKSGSFDANNQILILTQKEISDPVAFSSISELIKRLLMSSIAV
ncbi:hypothetical protein [Ekhidna sp. To15]|uniref:hypothetical protein n=1 Tax=Ekhidna sp. To15 TaxID=3395267 RepID=UPI003F525A32